MCLEQQFQNIKIRLLENTRILLHILINLSRSSASSTSYIWKSNSFVSEDNDWLLWYKGKQILRFQNYNTLVDKSCCNIQSRIK